MNSDIAGATPNPRPVMIYDGGCSFCNRWIERWRRRTGPAIDYQPYQQGAASFPRIPVEAFGKAVHLVEPDGRVSRGAAAVFRSFELANRLRWLAWAYGSIPGFAAICETVYAAIARHRDFANRLDLLLIGPGTEPTSFRLTGQIFLRSLGIIYIIAFVSLWVQIDGLIGSRGILPVGSYLSAIKSSYGPERYWLLPTLCWLNSSDFFLHLLCWGGVISGALMVLGIAQLPAAAVSWVCYLSLVGAGQIFLGYQWDCLLLEAGLLAVLFAPVQFFAAHRPEPSRIILWLLRWLLFRVMFMSGVVKLSSGDATWRNWTALRYHYETQPLPPWTSWYFFQAPLWFAKLSCGVVFLCELLIPLLIFGPRRIRLLAFWGIIFFQLLIIVTGNYGFFNLLTIALCFCLVDDAFWRWVFRLKAPQTLAKPTSPARSWLNGVSAVILLAVTVPKCIDAFGAPITWPAPIPELTQWTEPFESTNGYGLFAVMTTQRPEIIIEGSDDGISWKPYAFKWKPGDVDRRPAFVIPYMPRLDWQMWFSALEVPSTNPWMMSFMSRLLEGSPPVLRLLGDNPFPERPPRYVRGVLYQYHFTGAKTRRQTGAWWRREEVGVLWELSKRSVE
jgi:predicted DCC family thiol-disulfide oxidoreductase YuxK